MGSAGQVEMFTVPEEAFQVILVIPDGLGGLALTAAVEDVTLDKGLKIGTHLEVIQVVVSYFSHAVSARFSLKSRGERI